MAARITARYLTLDHPPEALIATLARALLREDAGFHAYQMLAGGEVIRDGRVVYVQPANDLKIDVQADRIVSDAGGVPGMITGKLEGHLDANGTTIGSVE